MVNKRRIGPLAACLLLLTPVAAGAVAGEGIPLGPVLFFPVLSVTATHDDNFRLAPDNPESGWVTEVAPSLRLNLPVHRFTLSAEGGMSFLKYYDIDEADGTDWYAGGAVGAEFPGGLSFKITDRQTQRYLTATQEYPEGEDSSENTLTASVAYAIRNALRLEFTGGRTAYAFDVSADRERVETTMGGGLYWKFRPTVSALVEGSYTTYAYDSNSAQDNSETQVALGLTWDVTARSTGFAKGGYQWKRYDQQDTLLGTDDAGYYTLSGGMNHSFSARTVFGFDLSRGSEESDFQDNPYYLRTSVGASLAHRLNARLYGRIGARWASDDYPNATVYDNPDDSRGPESGERTDTTLSGSVTLGFTAARWLSFEAECEVEQRDSTLDYFDYDVTRFSLSARAAF